MRPPGRSRGDNEVDTKTDNCAKGWCSRSQYRATQHDACPTGAAGPHQGLLAPSAGLWLVRHAQPLIASGVCYGATDIAADRDATQASASVLAQQLPLGTRLISSPLRRCEQLAQELRRLRPDLKSSSDARLTEMNFGCWEGWRWDDIPKSAIDQWTAQFGNWRFGGRESVRELIDRVAGVWRETVSLTDPVAWITHAGVIRAALLLSRGIRVLERSDEWPAKAPGFGQYVQLP